MVTCDDPVRLDAIKCEIDRAPNQPGAGQPMVLPGETQAPPIGHYFRRCVARHVTGFDGVHIDWRQCEAVGGVAHHVGKH